MTTPCAPTLAFTTIDELTEYASSTFGPKAAHAWHAFSVLVDVSSVEQVDVWAQEIKAAFGDRVDLSEFVRCINVETPCTRSVTIYRPGAISLGPSLFTRDYMDNAAASLMNSSAV